MYDTNKNKHFKQSDIPVNDDRKFWGVWNFLFSKFKNSVKFFLIYS